jgi:acyl-CoA thioesterase
MRFNTLLDRVDHRQKISSLTIPQNWSQGRTIFGGILTAMIVRAIKSEVEDMRLLRFICTSFVNPMKPDENFVIEVNKLQEGQTITQIEGRAIQDGKIIAVVLTGFGVLRESSIEISNIEPPEVQPPEHGIMIPYIPDISPQFLQNLDLSLVIGDVPFAGSEKSDIGGWMRYKSCGDEFTDAHLIALIDAWPVGVLSMLKAPAPMSTLNWNVQFVQPYEVAPNEWLLYKAVVQHTRAGYANSKAFVWNKSGRLIAISNQVVTIYESPGI